jgi:hypothetical protein
LSRFHCVIEKFCIFAVDRASKETPTAFNPAFAGLSILWNLGSRQKCERDDEKIRDGEEETGIVELSQCGSRAEDETA